MRFVYRNVYFIGFVLVAALKRRDCRPLQRTAVRLLHVHTVASDSILL